MPIRWYGPADPDDPTYRHFERIVNLTLHGALFASINSGLWVVEGLRHPWPRLSSFSLAWTALLAAHLLWVILQRPRQIQTSGASALPSGTPAGHPEAGPAPREQP